jgi:hypothetical protein
MRGMRCALSIHQKECRKSLGCALYIGALYLPENTVYMCLYMGHEVAQLVEAVLQAGSSRVRFRTVSLECFQWHNPSSRTMALGLTQPLTEMSTTRTTEAQKSSVRTDIR